MPLSLSFRQRRATSPVTSPSSLSDPQTPSRQLNQLIKPLKERVLTKTNNTLNPPLPSGLPPTTPYEDGSAVSKFLEYTRRPSLASFSASSLAVDPHESPPTKRAMTFLGPTKRAAGNLTLDFTSLENTKPAILLDKGKIEGMERILPQDPAPSTQSAAPKALTLHSTKGASSPFAWLMGAIPAQSNQPPVFTSQPAHLYQSLGAIQHPPGYFGRRETHSTRLILLEEDPNVPVASPSDDRPDLSPPHDALPHDVYAKLLLSDQDVHLLDFPDGPPSTSGGTCELYMAVHRPSKLKLAMKRPRVDFPTDETLRRFRREAEIWSTFDHVNILPFLGTIQIKYRLYLVSPWMALGDLLEFVKRRLVLIGEGKLTEYVSEQSAPLIYFKFNEARVIREIASGLEYLHSLGVVHGDMKAKNVLLSQEGRAQICDFGLTKTSHAVTSTGLQGAGSTRWQSPELLRNKPKSLQSDIYAFGMTVAEVLTGNYPYPHLNQQSAVILAVMTHERPAFEPLSRLGVDFLALWEVAAKCWERKPSARPAMTEVCQRLVLLQSDNSLPSIS